MGRKLSAATRAGGGRFAYDGLERVLHEKARLGILTALVSSSHGVKFSELKRDCGLTEGNLSKHLETLRQDAMIEVWKGFENRRPQTLCRVSTEGRRRFVRYLQELQRVVADALPKARRGKGRAERLADGWQRVT